MSLFCHTCVAAAALFFVVLQLVTPINATSCKAVKPAPRQCALRGHLKKDRERDWPIYEPQFTSTVEKCASFCARRRYNVRLKQQQGFCAAFRYDEVSKLCQLGGSANLARIVVQGEKSTNLFFTNDCFDCGPMCDQPYGSQLIDDADFEQPLLGPWSAFGAIIRNGRPAPRGYHCHFPPAPHRACELSQTFNDCYNQSIAYRVKFDYAVTTPNDTTQVGLYCTTDIVEFSTPLTTTQSLDWRTGILYSQPTKYSTLHSEYGTKALLDFGLYGEGFGTAGADAYIDNVHVSRVPTPPRLSPGKKSIIQNGDFESGDLYPWISSRPRGWTVVSPGLDSHHAASVHHPGASLSQILTTTPNTAYLLSFDVNATQIFQWEFLITMQTPDGDFSIDELIPDENLSLSYPIYINSSTVNMTIGVYAPYGHFFLDNFIMREIDEPEYYP